MHIQLVPNSLLSCKQFLQEIWANPHKTR